MGALIRSASVRCFWWLLTAYIFLEKIRKIFIWKLSYVDINAVKSECHRGIQLILAYSWARLAILVVGKGREEFFYCFCFFSFIPVPLSSLSLSFISSSISSISKVSSFLWETTQNDPQGLTCCETLTESKKLRVSVHIIFFLFLHENLCCDYSWEAFWWGAFDPL